MRFVRLPCCSSPVFYWNGSQGGTLAASSVVATCLEELPELTKDGVDKEVIRGVGGTVYLGERRCHMAIEE